MKPIIIAILNILDRQERIKLGKLVLFDLIICVFDIAFLGVLVLIINFYTNGGGSNNQFFSLLKPNQHSLLIIGLFLVLFCFKNCLGYFTSKAQHSFFFKVATRLSRQNILNFLKGDYSQFVHTDSSVQIRKISQQPIEFSSYILSNIQVVISQGLLILFTLAAVIFLHPVLFVLLFILLLPPVILLAYLIKKKLRTVRENTRLTSQKAIQHLQETLSGYVEGNIYDSNTFFTDRYYIRQQQLNHNIATQQSLQGLPSRLIEVFAVLGFFILIAINKSQGKQPGIEFLNVGVFMAASYKIIPGVVKMLNSYGQIKTYQFILDDLVPEAELPVAIATPDRPINSIKFDLVNFSYQQRQVLRNLCLEISKGDFVGISGKSGLGKTTIINLLLGFLNQDSGAIYINEKAASQMERQGYWPKISYAKQQPFFINDTILKNITLTDGQYDAAKLSKVLAFCGIDAMLAQYPEGSDKLITENGKNISGGQRQRVMLARVLYGDFDLLILDEPFSEMDEETERLMLVQLQQLAKQGKIIIIISHNISSLSYCTKILSLDGE